MEAFYRILVKIRDQIAKDADSLSPGLASQILMQIMALWQLQSLGFLDNDKNYLINKFRERRRLGFENYNEFLAILLKGLAQRRKGWYEDDKLGKILPAGPHIQMIKVEELENANIPDEQYYKAKGRVKLSETLARQKTTPPILNLLKAAEEAYGPMDGFIFGGAYEKMITGAEKKKLGSYYTPRWLADCITKEAIETRLRGLWGENEDIYKLITNAGRNSLQQMFQDLCNLTILDPAVGSGHFLESAANKLLEIHRRLRERASMINAPIRLADKNLTELDHKTSDYLTLLHIVFQRNLYGVDVDPAATRVAKARLLLKLLKHYKNARIEGVWPCNAQFNLKIGNSLIGYSRIGGDADLYAFSQPRR